VVLLFDLTGKKSPLKSGKMKANSIIERRWGLEKIIFEKNI